MPATSTGFTPTRVTSFAPTVAQTIVVADTARYDTPARSGE